MEVGPDVLLAASGGDGNLLIKIVLNSLAIFAAAYLMSGVTVKDYWRAVIVALLLAFLNATVGAVLSFLAFPLTFLTLGLFSFVIDAALLMIASHFLKGFEVDKFGTAFLLAIILAIFNSILHWIYF